MTVYSQFLSSLTHFSIYIKRTALLSVHILFLCLYKIYILIIFKIALISWYFQNIVSILYWNWKLKSWYWIITSCGYCCGRNGAQGCILIKHAYTGYMTFGHHCLGAALWAFTVLWDILAADVWTPSFVTVTLLKVICISLELKL